jgi:DnaD/phage-associated family protein
MSRTILAKMDGFTPVIDTVVEKTSLMTAVVFGRIWRFCQMKDGVCNASLEKIAQDIGIDKATAMRHAKLLVEAGYLEDLSPDLRNHPHTYRDTGKAGLQVGVSSVADSNAGVAQCNAGVAESKLKIDIKKDINIDSTTGAIFKVYENNIGLMTPIMADKINDAIKTYQEDWIIDALKEAVANGVRKWSYVEAILDRWQKEGKNSPKPTVGKTTSRQARLLKQLETA